MKGFFGGLGRKSFIFYLTARIMNVPNFNTRNSLRLRFAVIQILQNAAADGRVRVNGPDDYFKLLTLWVIQNLGQ